MVTTIITCVCVAYCISVICGVWLRERQLHREEMRDTSLSAIRDKLLAFDKRHASDLEQLGATVGELAGKVTKLSNRLEMKKTR